MFVLVFAIVFFSPKNLDFSNTFLDGQARIRGRSLMISTTLPWDSPEVKVELIFRTFGVNLFATLDLNELMYLSAGSESYSDL